MSTKTKYTYSEIRNYIENYGYILISKEFINTKKTLVIKDRSGYYYTPYLNNLLKNKTPERFHTSNPYTIQNIKLWCSLNNKPFKLISKIYVGCHEHLNWKCLRRNCGEVFPMTWGSVSQNQSCPYCAGNKKHNIDYIREYIKNNSNSKLLSTEYINAKSNLILQCECTKIFERSWTCIQSKNSFLCRTCTSKLRVKNNPMSHNGKENLKKARQKPIEDVIYLIENKMGCKFVKRYTKEGTRSTLIEFTCPKHGLQTVYWTNIVKRQGCPECNEHNKQNSKLTLKTKKYLFNRQIEFTKEFRFKDCKIKKPLPFDFYLPDYNLCIEIHGRQHYEKAYFGGWSEVVAEEKLKLTKLHDQFKNKYCENKNINLLTIPYWTDDKDQTWKELINNKIQEINFSQKQGLAVPINTQDPIKRGINKVI